jgi:SOS response regulatory protein OraA/RecX
MLYELLTGTKPHEGETPIQVAYKHVHEDVPAPSLRASGVPSYVDALVARYVEKGYIDDEGFARSKSAGLLGRGYGARRVEQDLQAAGIAEGLRARFSPDEAARREAITAIRAFFQRRCARKRRLAPDARKAACGDDPRGP